MSVPQPGPVLPPLLAELVEEATGRGGRVDPPAPRTGGPAGNARLTAWTGLVLLVLLLAQLVTLVDVDRLVTWHLAIGALLVPPALVKTASTMWRAIRYYTGSRPYAQAGPPPLVLRALGPAVVLSTLGVLATGVVVALLGPEGGREPFLTVLGQRVGWLTLHQAVFWVWAVVTGVHVLCRLVPALRLTVARAGRAGPVAGAGRRAGLAVVVLVTAVLAAVFLLSASAAWGAATHGHDDGPPHRALAVTTP